MKPSQNILVPLFLFTTFFSESSSMDKNFYRLCKSQSRDVKVTFEKCTTIPCTLKRGDSGDLFVTFTSPVESKTLTNDVRAQILGGKLSLPWPGLHRNACDGHGLKCPLNNGSKYTFKYNIKVLPMYPKINTTVIWKLIPDKVSVPLVCFNLPVQIV